MPIIYTSDGKAISYNLTCKKVKNINLRIKPDGSVNVSANRFTSRRVIDDFLLSKSDLIFKALKKYETNFQKTIVQHFEEDKIQKVILDLCKKAYPVFEKRGIAFPQIKFKKMVSRWGSCHSTKGILTFNTNLMYAPYECIEYVVFHEFVHFLQANHSPRFYDELEAVCPDWKERRQKLKGIIIQ